GHAAKGALVNFPGGGAAKRYTVMLKLDNRRDRFAAHIFDRILIAQPIRPLDRVVHVKAPVILAHIPQSGGNPALRRHSMRARREYLGENSRAEALFRAAEPRAQPRTARADNNDVMFMIYNFV